MMGVNTRNMYSCLQKCNKLNKSHLVGQLLNSIHDARTHVYKKRKPMKCSQNFATDLIQKHFNAPKEKRNIAAKLLTSSSRILLKDDSRSAGQEIPCHSWNPGVYFRVEGSSSQAGPLRQDVSRFQLSSYESLAGLPAGLFQVTCGFPQYLQANVRILVTSQETATFYSEPVSRQAVFLSTQSTRCT